MLRTRHVVLSAPLAVLMSALSWGADPPAVATLKEKGLARSGRYFVLKAEQAVVDKWKKTRTALADYTAAAERKGQAEQAAQQVAELEERRVMLQETMDALNQQINAQGFQQGMNRGGGFGQGSYASQLMAQKNMVGMNLARVVAMQRSARSGSGADTKALEAEGQKALEAARTALADLRASVDAVTKRYEELGADAAVKSAFRAMEREKMGTFKLGPTTAFKAVVKALENAERTVLAKRTATASRKKGRARK